MNKINQQFQFLQATQLALLTGQGILLLANKINDLSLVIWCLLGVAALLQVVIILKAPKKIEMSQLVDRSVMVRMRLFGTLPYIFIILGILYTR